MKSLNGVSVFSSPDARPAEVVSGTGDIWGPRGTFAYHRAAAYDIEAVTASRAPATWTELHDTFTVCTIDRGPTVHYRCGARRYQRGPAVGMLLGPSQLHSDCASLEPADYRVLRLSPDILASFGRGGDAETVANLSVVDHELRDEDTNELFASLHRAIERGCERPALDRLLRQCIAEIVRRCSADETRRGERQVVRRIREFALTHLAERITLDELAGFVRMGKWGLLTLFRRHVGVPPLRYVLQFRLARARNLLRAGRPPCAVASDLGFFDQSHLNRWFRRTYGVAPGEYQQMSRAR